MREVAEKQNELSMCVSDDSVGIFPFEVYKNKFYRHGYHNDDGDLLRENSTIDTFTLKRKKMKIKIKV